jgi:hypothetical protein
VVDGEGDGMGEAGCGSAPQAASHKHPISHALFFIGRRNCNHRSRNFPIGFVREAVASTQR